MAANEFLLQIVGQDVSPQSVDLDDLTVVIRGFIGALTSIAGAANNDIILLALIDVSGRQLGRDILTLTGSEKSLDSARQLIRSLNAEKQDAIPSGARNNLREIWKTVFRNGWDACEFSGNGSNIGSASIARDKELFPEVGTFRGDTVLYGECVRAGGEGRRTATLKLLNGERLTVRLRTKELAKELGHRLYQTVGLQGEAIWQTANNQIVEFRADALTEYTDRDEGATTPRTTTQAFRDLSEAAGNRWENVDPEEFVKEQRRD
jgi:hypothetical protein